MPPRTNQARQVPCLTAAERKRAREAAGQEGEQWRRRRPAEDVGALVAKLNIDQKIALLAQLQQEVQTLSAVAVVNSTGSNALGLDVNDESSRLMAANIIDSLAGTLKPLDISSVMSTTTFVALARTCFDALSSPDFAFSSAQRREVVGLLPDRFIRSEVADSIMRMPLAAFGSGVERVPPLFFFELAKALEVSLSLNDIPLNNDSVPQFYNDVLLVAASLDDVVDRRLGDVKVALRRGLRWGTAVDIALKNVKTIPELKQWFNLYETYIRVNSGASGEPNHKACEE